jgi:hypothetical protein
LSTLELNIRAKKTVVVPPIAPLVLGAVKLEEGKRYLTKNNTIVGPMTFNNGMKKPIFRDPQDGWIYGESGEFPPFDKTHSMTIVREWFPTWKEHDAWVAGKPVKCTVYVYPYKAIVAAFGENSPTTNGFWHKNYAPHNPVIIGE